MKGIVIYVQSEIKQLQTINPEALKLPVNNVIRLKGNQAFKAFQSPKAQQGERQYWIFTHSSFLCSAVVILEIQILKNKNLQSITSAKCQNGF